MMQRIISSTDLPRRRRIKTDRMRLAVFLVLAVLCFVSTPALADTPANCMYDQVAGVWTFYLGPGGGDNSIDCSAQPATASTVQLKLSDPATATDDKGNVGFWTMIYNQGFEVVINNVKYFAFSKYTQNGTHAESFCGETMVGWYHNNDGSNWGCYYGKRQSARSVLTTTTTTTPPALSAARMARPFRISSNMVNQQNALLTSGESTWEAATYDQLFAGHTVGDLVRMGGGVNSVGRRFAGFPGSPEGSQQLREQVKAWSSGSVDPRKSVGDEPQVDRWWMDSALLGQSSLPTAWDWRAVGGRDFVSPVRNQGKCGSCYSFASMGMLEARIRVFSNLTETPVLSTQDAVSCSEYSQGCDGGFPYLVAGKFGEDFGIVEESCFPYQGVDGSCSSRCQDPNRVWHTTNYRYVGGYYGATTPQGIQWEILRNGPVATSFMVYPDFQAYKGGVYTHKQQLHGQFDPFVITNHVVVFVGWGQLPDGTLYWTVKNSWGTGWGEKGFFRILRQSSEKGGECGIESLVPGVAPLV